jgi:hypothetical protein
MTKTISELNNHSITQLNLSNKELTLINSLITFYSTPNYIQDILPIISGLSNISLRVLDWFSTNYSKKYNISYDIVIDKKTIQFNVFKSYKAQLKAYSKKLFDPFCRGIKIPFYFNEDNLVLTTIGQLNFFKWAIVNDILKYVLSNLNTIDCDMNKNKSVNSKKKKILKSSEYSSSEIATSSETSETKIKDEIIVNFI